MAQYYAISLRITPKLPHSLPGFDGDERIFWEVEPKTNRQEAVEITLSGLLIVKEFLESDFVLFLNSLSKPIDKLLDLANSLVEDEEKRIDWLTDLRDWDSFRLFRKRHQIEDFNLSQTKSSMQENYCNLKRKYKEKKQKWHQERDELEAFKSKYLELTDSIKSNLSSPAQYDSDTSDNSSSPDHKLKSNENESSLSSSSPLSTQQSVIQNQNAPLYGSSSLGRTSNLIKSIPLFSGRRRTPDWVSPAEISSSPITTESSPRYEIKRSSGLLISQPTVKDDESLVEDMIEEHQKAIESGGNTIRQESADNKIKKERIKKRFSRELLARNLKIWKRGNDSNEQSPITEEDVVYSSPQKQTRPKELRKMSSIAKFFKK